MGHYPIRALAAWPVGKAESTRPTAALKPAAGPVDGWLLRESPPATKSISGRDVRARTLDKKAAQHTGRLGPSPLSENS